MMYAVGGLALALAVVGYLLYRAYKAIGEMKHRLVTIKANLTAKDRQLEVLNNARAGDGARAFGDGSF